MALVEKPFEFEPLFAEAVGFVLVDFSVPEIAVFQTDAGLAFEFPPAARAVLLRRRAYSRMPRPLAMTSISVISLIISNYTLQDVISDEH